MKPWLYPFTLILICIFFPLINFAQVDLDNGLMAYYPFNGNANDASGNGNNPIFNNAAFTTDYYGKANSAVQFNGVDTYIEIPNSSTLSQGNTISVCAWIKPTGFYYGPCHGNSVLMKGNNDFQPGNYLLRFDDNMYTGTNCDGGIPDTVHQTYYGEGTGLIPVKDTLYAQKNVWRSLVYTYDGLHARLYIDCNLVLDAEQPGLSFTNADNLFLGKLNSAQFPYWLNAALDEVRIYNRALNADEIRAYAFACSDVAPCGNWAKINQEISGVQIGDLDVSGNQLTVEALINRTTPYDALFDGGDIVSKHDGPGDDNYLLRPTVAQITTTNGFFETQRACSIELNKTYHVAMVYDGKALKFYRNGFLMSEVPASGNLYQNNWLAKIGTTANTASPYPADFIGYINEVRIWNVAKSQSDLRQYIDKPLPNPASQTGLLAYYTFDDLKNKQGNSQWDGAIIGDAQINQTNPACAAFIADSCGIIPESKNVIAGFTSPDTVCANTPVKFTNTSEGASRYLWSFCSSFNPVPDAVNIGNPNGLLNRPVFGDFGLDQNGNYYEIVTNHLSGKVTRLNFGTSLLNTPVAEDLGSFNDIIPIQAEGIQLMQVNNNWTAIIVGGGNEFFNSEPRIVKLDFGNSLANTPTATNWGNIGELNLPIDFQIMQENGNYYGFTMNVYSNTITRFDFGTDFTNTPNGVNLGNIGNLNYPDGFVFTRFKNNWLAFAVNAYSNTITRLNCGNSLTSTPVADEIVVPGNLLQSARDIIILQVCDQLYGYVVNGGNNAIVKLDFGIDLFSIPTATDIGNIGNFVFPHSFSDFFTEGNDIYAFISNVNSNSISRMRFAGCDSIAGSDAENPNDITYAQPGTYTVNLMVDVGLPTQTSYCKQVVVLNCDTVCTLQANFGYENISCDPKQIHFTDSTINADSTWWDFGNGQTAANVKDTVISYSNFGNYTVQLFAKTNTGCLDTATYVITVDVIKDSAITNNDTVICAGSAVQLNAIQGLDYCWQPATGLSNASIKNPVATPLVTTTYYLHVLTGSGKPVTMDSVTITVVALPTVNAGNDTIVCKGDSVQLNASGGLVYNWNASPFLSDTTIANPFAKPVSSSAFIVKGFNVQGCFDTDTVEVVVLSLPVVVVTSDTTVCEGGSVQLQASASGSNIYGWAPSTGLSNTTIYNPIASPSISTEYFVTVTGSNNCYITDSIMVNVVPPPQITTLTDTSICRNDSIVLFSNAVNTTSILWSPSAGLNNAATLHPKASPAVTTLYTVEAGNGFCTDKDSVLVSVMDLPVITASNDTTICGNAAVQLHASGGVSYTWAPATGLSDATIANPVAQPGSSVTYIVTGVDANTCLNRDSVALTVNPVPVFGLTPQNPSVCLGDAAVLTASGGDVYEWSPKDNISNPSAASITAKPSSNTVYQVIINNTVCKAADTLTTEIIVQPLPEISISKSNDIDCVNYQAQLTASGGISYTWSPASYINNIYVSNPIVNPVSDTWYSVIAAGGNNCTSKDSILVKSNYNPADAKFHIASAFTPNHDGLNDCFSVSYWGPADFFEIAVYNRWGQVIFHSNNISTCWDGNYKGQPQPAGTYVYQISVSSNCTEGVVHKKGTIVLVR